MMKALVIGATGATGSELVDELLGDPGYAEIVAFVRRPTGREHAKYSEVVTDFDKLDEVSDHIRGDVWFSCLGTTLKAAGTREKQWHIDHDIPARFADIARKNGIPRTVVLSAYGASTASKVFYSRMKGSLDDHITRLGFDQSIIFRPGLLLRKDTDRAGERISAALLKFVNALGLFRRFRPMPTSTLAAKLAKSPVILDPGLHVIELDEIFRV